jgi:hypothetical protein
MAPHRGERQLGILRETPRVLDQFLARGGRVGALAHALDQPHADTLFEFANLQAHRGLGESKLLRGGGEAAERHDFPQGLQLVEIEVAHALIKDRLMEFMITINWTNLYERSSIPALLFVLPVASEGQDERENVN